MKKLILYLFLLLSISVNLVSQTVKTVGTSGADYVTLKSAFDAINAGSITGNITLHIIDNTNETATASLNASGSGSANYTSISVYPIISGKSLSGNLASPLINLNGADNVTIDGSLNASGNTIDLTITNTSASTLAGTSTIRFINDASNNTVRYCNIKGSSTGGANGIVLFSTTTGSAGNDNNTINNNNITNSADISRPVNAIRSAGTPSMDNSGNIINSNNIYNVFNRSTTSTGINIAANNSAWTISGNSFYETAPFVPTASVAYVAITVSSVSGNNFSISDNFIGGSSASCGGSPWTKTNAFNNGFYGILFTSATGTASNIQNNTIRNFDWSNSLNGVWAGILVTGGDVNIGTLTGNTIGDITGTGSITVTNTTTGSSLFGIYISSTGNTNCRNNNIGSITAATAAANSSHIYGIYKNASAGTTNISDNTIGSLVTPNSIYASSGSTGDDQNVYGILNEGTGSVTISGNTIANLTNGSANTSPTTEGEINGISSSNGTIIISDNIIHDLKNSNTYTYPNQNASVCGISLTGSLQKTVTGNKIYNLSNTYSSFNGSIIGLYLTGGTGNVISSNFIHDLSVQVNSFATINGIRIASGSSTYANNIITLGGNSTSTIYGIYETGTVGNDNNLYFNTVYIGGNPGSGSNKSYALYSAVNTNSRDFRNNILVNERSTTGGSNLHYAIFIAATGGTLICDYNDYFVSGTGGTLGFYITNKTSLPIVTGQDWKSLISNPGFSGPGGSTDSDYIPSANDILANIGTGILTDYTGTNRSLTFPSQGAYEVSVVVPVTNIEVYKSSVLQATFLTLKDAFDAFNYGTLNTGDFEIRVTGNTSETSSAILNASGTGGANYSSITIFPTGSGYTISGNMALPLINLNGADNVIIDGRVNGTGSTIDLTITNTSASTLAGTSTIRFINDASNNTVRYCNIKGSSTGGANGIVLFSTTTGSAGNDNNTINNNNITNSADISRPVNAIRSAGTPSMDNSGNIINSNNIYNVFNRSTTSTGINIAANNSAWTISGNSFYETAPFVPTASVAYVAITVSSVSGNNFSISDNFIGGSSASCGGSPWTKTNAFNNGFYGILFTSATGTASNIQNNTIRNFDWSNSLNGVWAGILVTGGDVNIGTLTGNTIGDITGTGSITVTNTTTGSSLFGIYISSTGNTNCRNNNIGSITAATAAANSSHIYGIYKNASAGTTNISDNTIGSLVTPNSIYASSGSTGDDQNVYGILNEGTGSVTISGNTIANLTNGSANTSPTTEGEINGISSSNGTIIISDNIIHDLKNSNTYTYPNQNASVCGISLTGSLQKTVTGNKIYNLSNTYSSFNGSIIGLYLTGGTGNVISSNFIHDLSVQVNSFATINGIRIASGSSTYANNIITLGGNSTSTIYGIYETGTVGNDNNLYFNTVYIGGNPGSGSNKSYALYSAVNTNSRDFRNNILVNERSTTGGSNLHYAIFIAATGGTLICDYNDYFVSGTGGTLGFYITNKTSLPIVTGQDNNSYAINPGLIIPGGTFDVDYKIGQDLIGVFGTSITTDYSISPRNNPTMGAWERPVNKWKGTTSTSFNIASNWTGNAIPLGNKPNIVFDNAPVNDCYLDMDRSFNNITNGQSIYRLVTNSHKLTIIGNLIFTGGAQINASASGSVIEYAGTSAQTIETGQFLNEKVYNLSIENGMGVTLNCNFGVDNDMTINSGKLFTISSSKLLTVTGTLTNNAGFTGLVIKSDATGDGKLLNNTPDIQGTVELYLTGGLISPTKGIYHYIIPPVETMVIGTTPTIAEVKTALEITNFSGNLLQFNEPTTVSTMNQGWQYFDNYPGVPPGFTSVTSARGYNINLYPNADIIKFKGELNASQHIFNISYTVGNYGAGWNLVGNPYPCDYDLNGVTGLGTVVDGISNTVYYNNNGTYQYWNVLTNTGSTAGYTDIVPPMTGFYVVATNSSFTQLVLPVTPKSSVAGDTRSQHKGYSSSEEKEQSLRKIKLVLSKGAVDDETIVLLADDASSTYNEHYDAFKMFNENSAIPGIYSVMNGTNYFMKAVAGPGANPVVIPLKVTIKEPGTHEISVTEFDNLYDVRVVLKHGEVKTVLNKNSNYTFTSGAGTFSDFELIFGDSDIKTTETKFTDNIKVNSWYNQEYLYINSSSERFTGSCRIVVYDLQGKALFVTDKEYLVQDQTTQIPVRLPKGVYILYIGSNNNSVRSKFAVY